MNPAQLIEKLTKELSNSNLVKAFVLVGSQARETVYKASEYSDAEAYIVVNDEDVEEIEKQLPQVVRKLGKIIFSYKNQWAGFSTVFDTLLRLELPIAKLSELESIFSRPKPQEVKILFDKTNGKLEEALDNRPETIDFEKLFQDKVIDFWYMLILGVQYYKKGEIWNSRSVLQILQSSLIKLFELLNNPSILLLETNKRVEQFLTKEQIELLREVSPSFDEKSIHFALKRIPEIFSKVSTQIEDKYHFTYNKQIGKAVKTKLLEIIDSKL